ncbi:NBS-LRR type disease resistance protein [Melia azedarach]|uniref:NBS-LRR type disease resistance protein n=1 Tax=Melia azedarach TaxID=155640 RepID=A0ACC1Y3Z8_MELAZ|nr:NBS-LRR type disease resistance protein [Melia azedarach]
MGNVLGIQFSCDALISRCLNCSCEKAAYVTQLEDNLVHLETQLQKLIEVKEDLMTRVVNAEQQRMKRLNQVQGWLLRVEAAKSKVDELTRRGSLEKEKLCLGGFCSKNCMSSCMFGKEVAKMLGDMETLMGEGAFEVVAEKVPEAAVDEIICEPTIVGMDSIFEEVWTCLGQESVGIIGIYGMGGVGKTTLLSQINKKFLNMPKTFDVVIWVVVSKDLQLEKIQEKIGRKMGLFDESWKNKSGEEKASDIFKILRKKKFILLLDDIWERVDLMKVGVPVPNTKTASKVVFTTRSIDVCGLMEAHKKFKVKCLKDEEAWELFRKKVGEDTLNCHPDILELAKTVAKECDGLPLALKTIGRAMACKKTPQEWSYAIQMLKIRRSGGSEFLGMEKEVYDLLKFSYDSLPSDRIRSCLLYCSLFPEDYSIRKVELIDFWMGEELLDETDSSGIQNQGFYIIGVLLHACLMEEEEEHFVKMHDVIRDMALWIACEIENGKEKFLVRAAAGLTEASEIKKWERVRRVSLMKNQISNLSEIPECPQLLTLFLQDNHLKMINSDFFQFMDSLRVLSLSHNCYLTELPLGISKLVSLQYLDLSRTGIKELPKELKSLVNLRYLNLEFTLDLHRIPRKLIPSFSKLRVLKMYTCGSLICKQASEDNILFDGGEILVEELLRLKHLNVLTMKLKSCHALKGYLSSRKFQNCTQRLSLQRFDDLKLLDILCLDDLKHLNSLRIEDCERLEELKIDYTGEIEKARQLHTFHSLGSVLIGCCRKLRDLTWLIFAANLKTLYVGNCPDMEEIISAEKFDEGLDFFTELQKLLLESLPNLKCIYCKALHLPQLREIFILNCPELKKLPLDANSTDKRNLRIRGEEDWWKKLQWEDEETQNAFLPLFIEIDANQYR